MTFGSRVVLHLTWVLPVAFWAGSTSFDPPKILLWSLAVAAWLAAARPAVITAGAGALPLLAAAAGASLLTGGPGVILGLRTVLMLLLAAATAAAVAQADADGRRRFLWGLQAGGALTAAVALLQAAGLVPGVVPTVYLKPGIGLLGNPNYVSGLAAALWWPAALLAVRSRGAARAAALLVLALHGAVLAVNGAAGPVAAVAGAGLLMLPAWIVGARKRTAVAASLAAAALPVAVLASLAFGAAGALDLGPIRNLDVMRANDGELRIANWAAAVHMVVQAPVLGVGAGRYSLHWLEVRSNLDLPTPPAPIALRAHNETLQWLAETGLVGAAALVVALVLLAIAGRRQAAHGEDGLSACAALAGLTTMALHAAVSFPLHLPATGLAAAVYAGLLGGRPGPLRRTGAWMVTGWLAAVALVALAGREFAADLDLARGRRELAAGHPAGAVAAFDRGLDTALWPGTARLLRAQALRAVGRRDAARADAELSFAERPSYEAMLLLAEEAIDRGAPADAARRLDTLERCRPPVAVQRELRYLRAYAAIRGGADGLAHRQLEALLADAPGYPRALLALGYIAARAGRDAEAAVRYGAAVAAIEAQLADPALAGQQVQLRGMLDIARRALASVGPDAAGPEEQQR
ncbi:MAG TPA: O-antigen ligase family protein [Candidatus Krumholzibacteria bacterium]|nr:O-antigen ligase family protein [Candidatus Krumholzibacteria bacterium]